MASPPLSSHSSDQISSRTQVSVGVGPTGGGGGGGGGGSEQNRPNSGGTTKAPGTGISTAFDDALTNIVLTVLLCAQRLLVLSCFVLCVIAFEGHFPAGSGCDK